MAPAHAQAHASAIQCPTCSTSIPLDDSQQAALDRLVSSATDARIKLMLAERDRSAAQSAQQQVDLAIARTKAEYQSFLAERDSALALAATSAELEVSRAMAKANSERSELASELSQLRLSSELEQRALRDRYEMQLAERDEAIERLRDMKLRLSTKMVGETLEQHCENEFERVRAMAFNDEASTVTFEKDNDARSGSKGDYVYREHDAATGAELVSIMFEMKNEQTEGELVSAKHKNVEFLAKLDKDRREKGCEYAVLVSMLEPESDLYNAGIVDVSHLFPKTFVVRPQFFLVILTLIRNSARSAAAARAELEALRGSDVDLDAFEADLEQFKTAFGKNYESSSKHLNESIDRIDKVITQLNIVRESRVTSERQMRLARDKADDVTLRKLSRGNETVQRLIDENRG